MPKWITDEQGGGAWLRARVGCLTASRMADAMGVLKKGGESEARRKLKLQLLAERLSGNATEFFVSAAMMRGTEQEPAAKARFEEATGQFIQDCGFALHDTIDRCGASPDGLVGADSLIEIKNPETHTHLAYLLAGVVPEQYKPQMLLQLAVTGRKVCHFMSYDARLPDPHSTFIVDFEPSAEELAEVEQAAIALLREVDQMHKAIIEPPS
jgi:putative phage-type endonuclease